MSDPSNQPPPGPARRPYGMVRLPGPVTAARTAPRAAPVERRRWYGPRVTLPPLSIRALRIDPSGR
ncbi:hypothetical protein ACFYYR_21225 [Streptomyces sp. NPDC001922]|uniref:hypothetical protein n=1 Tax=Streptomyces sp. NPDC001922 TaxID=3364624 RepID=UPI0036BD667F